LLKVVHGEGSSSNQEEVKTEGLSSSARQGANDEATPSSSSHRQSHKTVKIQDLDDMLMSDPED